MKLKYLVFPTFVVASHSGYVCYRQYTHQEDVKRKTTATSTNNLLVKPKSAADTTSTSQKSGPTMFPVGTTDDLVQDSLQTGDIILFRRKWYYHHLPIAIAIKLYQTLFQSNFDHLGVVVVDPKFGTVYILEKTFLSGVKIRLFSERIAYSESSMIQLIPLLPRDQKIGTKALLDSLSAVKVEHASSELGGLYSAVLSRIFEIVQSAFTNSADRQALSTLVSSCPHTLFLSKVYEKLGIDVSFGSKGSVSPNFNHHTKSKSKKEQARSIEEDDEDTSNESQTNSMQLQLPLTLIPNLQTIARREVKLAYINDSSHCSTLLELSKDNVLIRTK
jgi:hypothetical protein